MKASALLLPAVLAAALLAGCTTGPGSDSGPPGNEVRGQAEHFENADVTVAVGETVAFRMVKGSHTVDFAENQAPVDGVSNPHSGNLNPGDTFQVTFTKAGSYPYFCQYHSFLQGGERAGMIGAITVTAGPG